MDEMRDHLINNNNNSLLCFSHSSDGDPSKAFATSHQLATDEHLTIMPSGWPNGWIVI